ncbi:hypothetical protein E2C01_017208 [Portunus trituberculatus]|uniref:Uncharacterized protein n=1 Tax=Portunus trituberculatus TaxID=210409 RepID=A0A5B7DS92_PORTR|nr:hypothetical protein [Portunus trituberculatus]
MFVSDEITGEDCLWNKDADFPKDPPLMFDDQLKLILPLEKDSIREVSWMNVLLNMNLVEGSPPYLNQASLLITLTRIGRAVPVTARLVGP